MPVEATKQGHQDTNQNQSGRENDPSKKRNTPDQYDEQQSKEQGAGKHTGQTGHENPRTGTEQGGQRQGGQQGGSERTEHGEGNKGGQDRDRNKSNETDERGVKQGQKH